MPQLSTPGSLFDLPGYSARAVTLFLEPRNEGAPPHPEAVGRARSSCCGGALSFYIRTEAGPQGVRRIAEARFEAEACPTAVAALSFATLLVHGWPVEWLAWLTAEALQGWLGPLPSRRGGCLEAAAEAVRRSGERYRDDRATARAESAQRNASGSMP
jgi:NifU-like protein involved in Fe-S cluster formation